MNFQNNYANELVRGSDDQGVDTRLHTTLEQFEAMTLECLTANGLFVHVMNIDNSLSAVAYPSPDYLSSIYMEIRKNIQDVFKSGTFYTTLTMMYRFTEQHDATEVDQIINSQFEQSWADQISFFVSTLNIASAMSEYPPYETVCEVHAASGYLLVMRFLALIKLYYPRSELADELSCLMNTPTNGIGLVEFTLLTDMKYGSVKALTSKEGLKRSGLRTKNSSAGLVIEIESVRTYLANLSGFRPCSGVTPKLVRSFIEPEVIVNLPDESELERQVALADPARYATNFCLIDYDGKIYFPIRVKNQDSGESEFRLSLGGSGGNKKENTIFLTDESEVKQKVIEQGMAVRACSLYEKKPPSLLKFGSRKIYAIYDFESKSMKTF